MYSYLDTMSDLLHGAKSTVVYTYYYFKYHFNTTIIILTSIFYIYQAYSIGLVSAQTNEYILISLANSSYSPMTNVEANQVKVSIQYQVNDESLENEKVNGIMKVYSSNG